jgi:peptidyl-prolyl cis-trans isomerase-like 1
MSSSSTSSSSASAPAANPRVRVDTTLGSFVLELYDKHAPNTCRNFVGLTSKGFYDGTVFHRVISNFMAQGGDPTGTGRGGDSVFGGAFADEISPALKFTGAGILAMANSGPNTNKSQFFVTFAPTPHLDGKHTIFGRVFSGMETVVAISNVATGANDRPVNEVKVVKMTVL